jgi:hypothetical protein
VFLLSSSPSTSMIATERHGSSPAITGTGCTGEGSLMGGDSVETWLCVTTCNGCLQPHSTPASRKTDKYEYLVMVRTGLITT